MKIVTRFAPSPTGNIHVGNIRTALYAWLFARRYHGTFILRIEDTDFKRCVSTSIKEIMDVLNWLGLFWDKGPFYQSHRLSYYQQIINFMLNKRTAYKCYCSVERLFELKEKQIKNKKKVRYDGKCRKLLGTRKSNVPFVVRFCNPLEGKVVFMDQVRGLISVNNNELDDLIIQRYNGVPTYNFCVVADDIDMKVTHVIRGEEHINNTPRQINIYKSLGKSIPQYAHISMIVNSNRKKISKRDNTDNLMNYYNQGFLPEAILNYIVKLGWSYGNKEIFSIEEMQKLFSLKSITTSSSCVDIKKLQWLNNYYIKNLSISVLIKRLQFYLLQKKIDVRNGPKLSDIVKLLRSRCNTLVEMVNQCRCFYIDYSIIQIEHCYRYLVDKSIVVYIKIFHALNNIVSWNIIDINEIIRLNAIKMGLKIKDIAMPLRISITGTQYSPSIDKVIFYTGKKRVLLRIKQTLILIRKKINNRKN